MNAQPLAARSVAKQFDEYHQQSFTEKLYVHTDRQFYLAGETIWFKIYYLDGKEHKPAKLSRIAYVDILDKDNKPAVHTMIALHEGSGNGSVQLPFSMVSGMFRLRAYTSWMRNFDAAFYFEKPVTIANALRPLDLVQEDSPGYNAQFFPEGGHLVQNVEGRVAFSITASGKGLSCKGVIVKNNRDTIRSFETLKFGMGHFTLEPETGALYKAVIRLNDTVITRPLPVALPAGYVMNMSKTTNDQLAVTITTNFSEADSVILFVHTRHAVKYVGMKNFRNGVASFLLDKKILGEGISHFTAFDKARRPVCERLYFVRPKSRLSISAISGKETYGRREKVTISVAVPDTSAAGGVANLSVSVFPADALQSVSTADLHTYTWLQSDLRGTIESPQFYITDTASPDIDEATDLLMLTHGWRKFTWQDVLSNQKSSVQFLPELSDHIIHTSATHAATGRIAKDVVTYLSIPANPSGLYGGKADEQGITRYYVKDLFGKNELIIQPAGDSNTRFNIVTKSPFSENVSATPLPAFALPPNTESLLLDYSINVQVQHTFADRNTQRLYNPVRDSTTFYGTPDAVYMLDNYVRFSAMEDVLREYVPGVLVRRRREDFHLIMADGNTHRYLDDPLTLLNGIPVSTNKIMQYNPLKVRKLEVVKRKYFYGPFLFNGIINLTTYQPDPGIISGLNATILDYEGVQYERAFYSPAYETAAQVSNRLPDFRNTLYWSPDVMKGKRGKADIVFYTSDRKGDYVVVIEGMNKQGNMGTTSLPFRVE
jgi:hypothetical protein